MACIGESGFMQAISLLHVNIPWHTAGVELLQQWQINGCGTVQAGNGDCYMHMYKRNKGRGSPCKENFAVAAVIVLPVRALLISRLS